MEASTRAGCYRLRSHSLDGEKLSSPVFTVVCSASASIATRSEMARLAAENLLASLAGDINDDVVNPEITGDWRSRISGGML